MVAKTTKTKETPKKVVEMKKAEKPTFDTIEDLLIHVQSQLKIEKDIDNSFGGFSYYTIDNMMKQMKRLQKSVSQLQSLKWTTAK